MTAVLFTALLNKGATVWCRKENVLIISGEEKVRPYTKHHNYLPSERRMKHSHLSLRKVI